MYGKKNIFLTFKDNNKNDTAAMVVPQTPPQSSSPSLKIDDGASVAKNGNKANGNDINGNNNGISMVLESHVNQNKILQKRISDYELYMTPMVKQLQQREEEIKELRESNEKLKEKCKLVYTQEEMKQLIKKCKKLEEKNFMLEARNTQLHVRNIGLENSLRQAGTIVESMSAQVQQQQAGELLQTIQASNLREQLRMEKEQAQQQQAQALQRTKNDEDKMKLHKMLLLQRQLLLLSQEQQSRRNADKPDAIEGSAGGRSGDTEVIVLSDNNSSRRNEQRGESAGASAETAPNNDKTCEQLVAQSDGVGVSGNGHNNKRRRTANNNDDRRIDAAVALRNLQRKARKRINDEDVVVVKRDSPGTRVSDDESCGHEDVEYLLI